MNLTTWIKGLLLPNEQKAGKTSHAVPVFCRQENSLTRAEYHTSDLQILRNGLQTKCGVMVSAKFDQNL